MRLSLAFFVFAVAASSAAAARAAPVPVTGGSLIWTQFNVYDSGSPAGTNRTWLGYTTSLGPPFTNGTMSAEAGASGSSVNSGSRKGADAEYPVKFPAGTGGSFDPVTGTGEIEFTGTLKYASSAHGFTITVTNPKVILAPGGATLVASGTGSSGSGEQSTAGTPYDRSRPVFTLDLAGATRSTAGAARKLTGIAPAVATADMVWPGGSYPVGAGPDRKPNTFGVFALEVETGSGSATATVAKPKVSCKPTRTKGRATTTCEARVAKPVRRVEARAGGKRLDVAAVRKRVAKLVFARKRRTVWFLATDAKGRELSRRKQAVAG